MLHAGCVAGLVDEPPLRYRISDRSLTGDRLQAQRSRVHVLELAARLYLSADQRSALERFLARRRRRVLLAEAEQALREGTPDARRRSLVVAASTGVPLRSRALALVSAIAPRLARRRLASIEARTGH